MEQSYHGVPGTIYSLSREKHDIAESPITRLFKAISTRNINVEDKACSMHQQNQHKVLLYIIIIIIIQSRNYNGYKPI